jgi:hypothetical protein
MFSLNQIAQALGGEVSAGQVRAPGPGHSRADRSLSVKINDAGDDVVVKSFAGDDPIQCKDYIRGKLGLPAWQPQRRGNGKGHPSDADIIKMLAPATATAPKPLDASAAKSKVIATYDYTDAAGALLYQVQRLEPKSFRQRRPDGNGGWLWKLADRRVLYRWPEILKYPDGTVFFTEGEKDCDRLASLKLVATTVASGKLTDECVAALAGRDVVILQDNDDAGYKKAHAVATALHGVAKTLRVVLLPDLPPSGDASDWLDADPRRAERFVKVCLDTPEWAPSPGATTTTPDKSEPLNSTDAGSRLIVSTCEFVTGFVPPDYLIDGLVQRRFLYAMTAPTGTGKTAIALRVAAHVDRGLPLAGREIDRGKVLFFAGENPDDVRMRWIKLLEEMSIDQADSGVFWCAGSLKLSDQELRKRIDAETATHGPFALVIVDTSAAFFAGDDENNNAQMAAHARMLRTFVDTPGGPTVLVTCHPVKSPNNDNLLPRGGGAFLNEVDGNLVCIKQPDSQVVELHWHGKFRGPDFGPIPFALAIGKTPTLVDSKGRAISTVTARPISQTEVAEADVAARFRQDGLLDALKKEPGASLAELGKALGWFYANGEPNKTLVSRTLKALENAHLIKKEGRQWTLTKAAEKAAKGRFSDETIGDEK